jgi:hypothetical protein
VRFLGIHIAPPITNSVPRDLRLAGGGRRSLFLARNGSIGILLVPFCIGSHSAKKHQDTMFSGHTHCAYYREDCATGFTREGCASFDSCSFGQEMGGSALQFLAAFIRTIHSTKKRHDTITCSSLAYTLHQLSQKLCRVTCDKQRGLALILGKNRLDRHLFPFCIGTRSCRGHTHCAYYREDCATWTRDFRHGAERDGFDSCLFFRCVTYCFFYGPFMYALSCTVLTARRNIMILSNGTGFAYSMHTFISPRLYTF